MPRNEVGIAKPIYVNNIRLIANESLYAVCDVVALISYCVLSMFVDSTRFLLSS